MVRAGVVAIAVAACRLETEGLGQADVPFGDARPVDARVADTRAIEDTAPPDVPPRVVVDAADDGYFLVKDALDWYDARDECVKRGGHLATITSAKELERAKAIGTGDRWLGLRKDADAGVFGWITGEPVELDAWKSGEPNGSGSCGKIVDGGEWWDHSCLDPLPAICERD
jgi:hypothetical protein